LLIEVRLWKRKAHLLKYSINVGQIPRPSFLQAAGIDTNYFVVASGHPEFLIIGLKYQMNLSLPGTPIIWELSLPGLQFTNELWIGVRINLFPKLFLF